MAARAASGPGVISSRLLWIAALATILPDVDVVSFAFGIPYSDPYGHRGFTHSIAFAAFIGILAAVYAPQLNSTARLAFWLVFVSTLSHPFLDSFTNGGLGVAWFWPIADTRYFMPWQPIEVSPIGARGFFTERGLVVLVSEFFWVVLPLTAITLIAKATAFRERHQTPER